VLQFVSAAGHATLTKPVTRNRGPLDVKGPADYQSGNGGGKGFNAGYQSGSGSSPCGDGLWGFSNNQGGGGVGWHYRGGDAKDASLHESWKLMLKDYNPALAEDVRQTYVQGQNIEVQVQITAYHGGFMTFHLCPVKDGELDFDVSECGLLEPAGSAAHSKYLLRNLTSATLPMPSKFCNNCAKDRTGAGFCGYIPGCLGDGPDGFAVLDIILEASNVAMDHGVLVWHWFTANNGDGFVGGEEFMNCADVRISPSGSGPAPTPVPFSTTTAAPVTTTSPSPKTSTTVTSSPSTSTTEAPTTTRTTGNAGGLFCKGNPARWTTDEQCAQCAAGYAWWPCNEAELCFCTGALSQLEADKPKKQQIKSHKFLSGESVLIQVAKRDEF
jgi:hypothetical protein